jgi:anti-anti-sigma factor
LGAEEMRDEGSSLEIVLAHLDGYARVKLRGELDYLTVSTHGEAIQKLTELRRNVVIDLAEVGFIDSGGLAALIAIAREHEGPVRLEGLSPANRRLFATTGLDTVFDLQD